MKKRVVANDEGDLKVEVVYPTNIMVNGIVIGQVLAWIPRDPAFVKVSLLRSDE